MGYLGKGVNFANVAGDTFTGDGSTTGFTMTHTPGTKHAIDVYLAGVWQHKSTFSISGTTLTFDTAPPDGVEIAVEYRGLPISIGTPADDSVGRAQIDVTSLGPVVQTQFSTFAAGSGTTDITHDNSIPQISEGDEIGTLAITPKNTSNILVIEASALLTASTNVHQAMALFQDSTADALQVAAWTVTGATSMNQLNLVHRMTAGTVSSTTFSLRAGHAGTGTTYWGQDASVNPLYGLSTLCWMKITEYLAAN